MGLKIKLTTVVVSDDSDLRSIYNVFTAVPLPEPYSGIFWYILRFPLVPHATNYKEHEDTGVERYRRATFTKSSGMSSAAIGTDMMGDEVR